MATNLFDANFYRALYPDLGRAGITTDDQLRQHFVNAGANEGRQFSRFADLNYYAASYLDLTRAGLTKPQLFSHMETFSLGEKRRQGLVFNASYYAAVNPDLKQANLTDEQLIQHYQTYGLKEGRTSSEFFNARYYLDNNADLKTAFGNNFESAEQHFVNYGYKEGRIAATPVAPASDPGNSPTVSYDLGSLRTRPTLNDFVGTPDPEDYYSFNLDRPSNLNLTLNGLSNNATLKLFADVNTNNAIEPGEEIASVSGSSSSLASINKNLAQGRYYVDVITGSPTTNTSYSLSFAANGIPTTSASDPGSTPGTALNVDALTGTRNYQDFVGTADRQDFYRFVLNNTLNNFSLSLNGVSDTAVANVYGDSNNNGSLDPGEFLASTTASSSSVGSLARSFGAGTYFVEITTSPIANTSYNLTLTA